MRAETAALEPKTLGCLLSTASASASLHAPADTSFHATDRPAKEAKHNQADYLPLVSREWRNGVQL